MWRAGRTSVQAAGHGVALAGGALEEGRGAVDEGAGLARLCLRAPAVPKLGAHHQEALGGWLWGHQPGGHRGGRVSASPSQAPRHCPPCAPAAAGAGACLPPGKEAWRRPGEGSSPEEGVMLYADLPEPLGRAVVGQLEANGALKLFVLGGDRDRLLRAHPALGDMAGQHLAKVLGFPWQEPQPCKKTPKIFFKSVPRRSVPSTMPSRVMGYTPHLWPKHFPQL